MSDTLTQAKAVRLEPVTAVIEARDLRKVYRLEGGLEVHALRGLDLTIARGQYAAIMGPSGSGKSTLLQILGCLDLPTSGSYKLAGEEVSELEEDVLSGIRNRRIGFIFPSLQPVAEGRTR